MNTIVSFFAMLVVLVASFVATYPDPPVTPILIAVVAVAVVMPLAFFPVSKTLWVAVDLAMRPLEPGEVRPPWGQPA